MKFVPGSIIAAFRKKPADPLTLFLTRFSGRTIIIHEGLSIGWIAELMKEAGGGAHFRFDVRNVPGRPPTPIEWLIHRHVLPQRLPLPCLMRVEPGYLRLRHLTRGGRVVHPSELYWMLREFPQRVHLVFDLANGALIARSGIPLDDNKVDFDLGDPT